MAEPGTSSAVTTQATPGIASAGPTSMAAMRAYGWGDRSVRPHNIPSAYRSDEKAKRPWTLGVPSGRTGLSPTRPSAGPPRTAGGDWRSVTADPVVCDRRRGANGHDLLDRGEDPAVAGAAAQVAGQRLAHVERAGLGHPGQEVVDGDHEARGAEAALHAAGLDHRLLDVGEDVARQRRVPRLAPGRRETLDGGDGAPDRRLGQLEAGAHEHAVDQHRARAALALLAGVLGAGQPEPVAQDVEQAVAAVRALDAPGRAVDHQVVHVGHAAASDPAAGPGQARSSARRASTPTAWRR